MWLQASLWTVAWICLSATSAFILSRSLSLSPSSSFFFKAVAQRSTWLERRHCSGPPCVLFFFSSVALKEHQGGGLEEGDDLTHRLPPSPTSPLHQCFLFLSNLVADVPDGWTTICSRNSGGAAAAHVSCRAKEEEQRKNGERPREERSREVRKRRRVESFWGGTERWREIRGW